MRQRLNLPGGLAARSVLALLVLGTAARAIELSDVRHVTEERSSRLILELDAPVEYRLRAVPAHHAAGVPSRLYVDLSGARQAAPLRRFPAAGPIHRVRSTQRPDGTLRLILDVPGLYHYRAIPLPEPFRLVIVVYGDPRPGTENTARSAAVDEDAVGPGTAGCRARVPPRAAHALADCAANGEKAPGVTGGGTAALRNGAPAVPVSDAARAAVMATLYRPAEPKRPQPTIVLDPGHGGKDPGATGVGGLVEKDVVLAVSRRLRERLEAIGYRVLLTRDRDVFLPLFERTRIANRAGADLFVSIHANASRSAHARGIEVYYLSNTDDRATIRLAKMENDLEHMIGRRPGRSDVSWIVSDLIQQYKIEESLHLAGAVQRSMVQRARTVYRDARDLGAKPGPFAVLVGAGMPAILAEISFLTNPTDAAHLSDPSYRDALVDGLVRGIRQFVENARVATL